MKKVILVLFAALYLWGCECEEVAPTLADDVNPFFITGSQTSNNSSGNFFSATFFLNKSVDTSTVKLGTSVIVDGLNNINIEKFFNSQISIFGNVQGCTPNTPICTGTVRIIFKGDGSNPVRSVNGQKLDGDKDGSDGGDAAFTFKF